jgi:multidrug transporter EmrE-like cation transporter
VKYTYIFATVVFTVYGQLILKWRLGFYGQLPDPFSQKLNFLLRLFFDGYILSGFAAAFAASLAWMAAMTKFDISHAYPIIVGGLAVLTSAFAVVAFREPFNLVKVSGLCLIITGVYCLSKGS